MSRKRIVMCRYCGKKDTYNTEMINKGDLSKDIWVHKQCVELFNKYGDQLKRCAYCGKMNTMISEMIEYKRGVRLYSYVHKECNEAYVKKNEAKVKEDLEKEKLYELIMKIHDAPVIDRALIIQLEALRNGEQKGQKKGVPFSLIQEAYEYSTRDINYARMTKRFKNMSIEMVYCFKIVKGNINTIYKKKKRKEKEDARREAQIHKMIEETAYESHKPTEEQILRRHNSGVDISDLLD